AEFSAEVREDLLFRARGARERDRNRGDALWVRAASDLEAIPRSPLQVLRGDRVGVEVARAHKVERPAHEPRADNLAPLDRGPEPLALEVGETRPERHVRQRGPLRLQRAEPLDRGTNADPRALQEHLTRERGAVELAQ